MELKNYIGRKITREVAQYKIGGNTITNFGVVVESFDENLFLAAYRAPDSKNLQAKAYVELEEKSLAHMKTPRNKRDATWYQWASLCIYHTEDSAKLMQGDAWECEIVHCFANPKSPRKFHFVLRPLKRVVQVIADYDRDNERYWDVRVFCGSNHSVHKQCTMRGNAYRDLKWTYHFNEFVENGEIVASELLLKLPIKTDKVAIGKTKTDEVRGEPQKKRRHRQQKKPERRTLKSFAELYDLLPTLARAA